MRRLLPLLFVAFTALSALSARAGATYELRSETSGAPAMTALVSVDGPHLRMDVRSGDAVLFRAGTVVLSDDGGKTLKVIDPKAKTYFVIAADAAFSKAATMFATLGMTFRNPRVSTRDLGSAGTVAGFPARRTIVNASCDVVMGERSKSEVTLVAETWSSDRINAAYGNALQSTAAHTGIAALDRMLDASAAKRFPLKQVTTLRLMSMEFVTTSTVTNFREAPVAASTFAVPSGLRRVDSPLDRL